MIRENQLGFAHNVQMKYWYGRYNGMMTKTSSLVDWPLVWW